MSRYVTADSARTPLSWSSLVGRDRELAALESAVRQQRLVTLWGPGGSGKTRLAQRVAERLEDTFGDGVRLVACGDVPSSNLLVLHVASTLGLHVPDESSPIHALVEWLRARQFLLVLDNCEHLVTACASLVDAVLSTCPRVHVLITSRELLSLPAEQAYPVPPLALPPPERFSRLASLEAVPGPARAAEVEHAGAYSAIQLFVLRAQRVQPDFDLTQENVYQVVSICRLLDGLPLAIELAAARIRMLALGQLAERLAASSAVLGAANRLAPARQQTLEATISWSYDLLTPLEQQMFRRLSLLAGSFDLSLAEALGRDEAEPVDALDLLGRLIDKSLVSVVSLEGTARYRLLDTVRQFGRERLQQSGETEAAYQQYGAWVHQLAEEAETQLRGPHQGSWLDRIEAEFEHIRVVMRWYLEQGNAAPVVRVSTVLVVFCEHRTHAREVSTWLETALAQKEPLALALQARAFLALGTLSIRQAPIDQLHRYLNQAQEYLNQAEERYTELDDQAGMASTLCQLGYVRFWEGDYPAAVRCFEAGLALADDEKLCLRADLWDRLAITRSRLGDRHQAVELYQKSLTIRREIGDISGLALTLAWLGGLFSCRGDQAQAEQYLRESLTNFAAVGARGEFVCALVTLCDVALARGEPALIRDYLGVAFASGWSDYDLWLAVDLFDRLARLALLRGRPLEAARLFGVSATYSRQRSSQLPRSCWDALQAVIPHGVVPAVPESSLRAPYDAAWREGQNMELEEAFTFALDDFEAGASGPDRTAMSTDLASVGGLAPTSWLSIPSLRFLAFGGGQVYRHEDTANVTWHYSKARELLFYLLDSPYRTKDQICLALWPDVESRPAGAHMRVTLYHLRRTLGDAAWILHTNDGYACNRALPYWYDVERFESLLTQADTLWNARPHVAGGAEEDEAIIAALAEACALYRGEYLADLSPHDWITDRQAQLRRNYTDALRRLGQSYQRQGDTEQALTCYQRLTAADPYDEQAHAAILRCYIRLGQRSRALRYYRDLQNFLRDELGVTPDPHITAFVKAVLAQSGAAS